MSYILEALRKADAERDQGVAPALPEPAPTASPASARGGVWRWIAAGAAIPVVALLAWRLATQPPEPASTQGRAAPAASAGAAPAAPAPAGAASPAVAPAAEAQAVEAPAAPAAAAEPTVDAVPAATAAAPVPAAAAPIEQSRPPAAGKPARAATPRPAREPAPGPERTAPPPAEAAKLPKLQELPEELRRQVPPIALGGSVYSPRAEDRMLIVNGQVVREGAELAPGLRVESIRRKSAVLSIRGRRFELEL